MTATDDERELARGRRTLYLIIAAAASLLLPLLGVLYLWWSGNRSVPPADPSLIFARRDAAAGDALKPAGPIAAPPISAPRLTKPGNSLSFVRGDQDYDRKPPARAAAPKTAARPAKPRSPSPKPLAASKNNKPFVTPHLRGVSSPPPGGAPAIGSLLQKLQNNPQGGASDVGKLLQGLPSGASGGDGQ
ncbi:MAG: hypothetical protein KGO96_09635 [Elusimicrobia bacterium]|nr:hypothetical protein [Elusimicrobiota bacterium]MDE2426150.1 hypothetical protein [Elusimicrobiota bacterium]